MWKAPITLVALLPSMWMLWQAGGLPHLGYFHDDGLYAGTAAALADGRGPRVESLPGEPWQVKYPPLFPLYLALGVKWELVLLFLVWLPLPALMYQVWRWRGDMLLVFLLGWNVFAVVFSGTALSEVFATVLVVASIRHLERGRTRTAAVYAGLTYLARTALIALPAGALLWLLTKKRWREAGVFAAIFAPFFVGWSAFVATHTTPGVKGGAVYYLSYSQFFRENMDWGILPTVLSINAQELVGSLGGILFFNTGDSFWELNFARLVLFAAVAGLVRQFRRDGPAPYTLMALPYLALLVAWNFVPNARFVFPLFPLLLDGLLTELRHFRDMLKVTWTTQRAATVVIGALVAAGAGWTIQRNAIAVWKYSPSIPLNYRAMAPDRELAYAWIRANTPADANFLVYEDPALRRHTGRHGIGIHCPTRLFYTNDMKGILAYHEALITNMRDENLQYLLIGPNDLAQDIQAADREKILDNWKTRDDLETVYQNDRFRVRRLRPVQSGT
ncbi:MAG: glycosyltransferase family 87 protein [Bryobacteraceae bacterium]